MRASLPQARGRRRDTGARRFALRSTAMPGLRSAVVSLLVLLGGCSPLLYVFLGEEEGQVGRIELGQIVSSTTADDEDHWEPDCGAPAGGGDETWLFTPETT